jgi:peptidoglycan hydrolase-like protein with peptidoglycan-binding domain
MKSIIALSAICLIFLVGCKQKAEEPTLEPSLTTEATQSPEQAAEVQTQSQTSVAPAETVVATQETTPEVQAVFVKPTVEEIQQALKNLGLYGGNIDGDLGPKTQKAIEDFQAQNNLKVDGKVGPKTWEKLKVSLTPTKPETTTSENAY